MALPGLGPALLFRPRPTWPLFLARSFLWGPLLAGVIATLLDLTGFRSLITIVFPVTAAAILVIAFIVGARREDRESPEEGPWEGGDVAAHAEDDDAPDPHATALNRALVTAFLIGAGLAVLVILPALLHPWIRERGDSWFHAAIVQEILHHGVPPEDPYFAGLRLQYMWFFHEILAGLELLTGVSPFFIMIAVNALALIALCVLVADLSRALWDDPRAAAGAALVTPLGLGVLFWVFFPIRALRAMTGATAGSAPLADAFRLAPFDILSTRQFLTNLGSSPFFLNKFMVGTAYGLALALLVAYLASIVRWFETRRRSHLIGAGLELLAMLLLHPVVGLTALALSGITGAAFLLPPFRHPRVGFRTILAWGIAAAAAVAIAAPYILSVTRGRPAGPLVPFHFDAWIVAGILAGCLFVILASIGPLRELARRGTAGGRLLLLWIPAMILFAAFVRLPGPNSSDKFTYLVYLPLALAAGAWAGRALKSARGALLVALILIPANVIGYAGYWGEPAPPPEPEGVRAAYAWIRANTPDDAIVVEKEGRRRLLVEGPRRLWFASASYAEQWGYDPGEMAIRAGVIAAIYDGAGDVTAAVDRLAALDRPVYIVLRDGEGEGLITRLERFDATTIPAPVFENGTIRILRVR